VGRSRGGVAKKMEVIFRGKKIVLFLSAVRVRKKECQGYLGSDDETSHADVLSLNSCSRLYYTSGRRLRRTR
jgi:hypothetical protein